MVHRSLVGFLSTLLIPLALAWSSADRAAASPVSYIVTINTSTVSGQSGFLDLKFNPGNATTQPATVQILNYSGGSLVGPPSVTGNVTGTLPPGLTMVNSTALNDYFEAITFGSSISFVVTLSGPAIDAPNGTATAGSTFGVGLYDSGQSPILTNQALSTGFAGTIDVNLNGTTTTTAFPSSPAGAPSVVTFASATTVPTLSGPAETFLSLALAGLALFILRRKRVPAGGS